MSTALAPQQSDTAAWKSTRAGRFTASRIGALMTERETLTDEEVDKYAHLVSEPRFTELKSGPNKGERKQVAGYSKLVREAMRGQGIVLFGEGALTYIAEKAAERVACLPIQSSPTGSMRRGTVLEFAALFLLTQYWKPVDGCLTKFYGDNAAATPDGLVDDATATMDLKCPESFADVLRYAEEVPDGDFDALEAWNKTYAWQVMMQAKASGLKYGYLVYFTDRMPWVKLTDEDQEHVRLILETACERASQESEYPYHYTFASDGFAFAARRFELTEERSKRIDQVLQAAEVECVTLAETYRTLMAGSREQAEVIASPTIAASVQDLVDTPVIEERKAELRANGWYVGHGDQVRDVLALDLPGDEIMTIAIADLASMETETFNCFLDAGVREMERRQEVIEAQEAEAQEIETEEAQAIRALEVIDQHLADMPWPAEEIRSRVASFAIKMIRQRIKDARDIAQGTIEKDLQPKPVTTKPTTEQ
jgi:hypothetical protein